MAAEVEDECLEMVPVVTAVLLSAMMLVVVIVRVNYCKVDGCEYRHFCGDVTKLRLQVTTTSASFINAQGAVK